MPCYHPKDAVRTADGKILYGKVSYFQENLKLPCGQCIGCRLERSASWAARCVQEASLYGDRNEFVTLTYAPEHLPYGGVLVHRHFQLFFKRLRKAFGKGPRYFMCGEYGENKSRPHYHAIVFNWRAPDREPWKIVNGNTYYKSKVLQKLWGLGHTMTADVTFESSAYVARYITKKINGKQAALHYEKFLPATGELISLPPEYCKPSSNPGIGSAWFDKFHTDLYPSDQCIIMGKSPRKLKVPRYYDKKLEKLNPELMQQIKKQRLDRAKEIESDLPERLLIREEAQMLKAEQLLRGYENGSSDFLGL